MGTLAFDRIENELDVHPKERIGFRKSDFLLLDGEERRIILERLLNMVENGWGYSDELEWLLGDEYIATLKKRLATIPARSHGLVYLPYFIFTKTQISEYLGRMMNAIIEADPDWEGRERAIGGYLRRLIGQEPVFWDFCRFIVLNVPEYSMKDSAITWLASEKGYPLEDLTLSDELTECLEKLFSSKGADKRAIAILDKLHRDSGAFSYP